MRKRIGVLAGTVALAAAVVLVNSTFMNADGPAAGNAAPPRRVYCEDWAKPDFVLFITGRQHGYIEPCGCTGLQNQKGGLARRHTLYNQLLKKGWDVVPIDVGNQIRRFGAQPAIKFQTTMSALKKMKYQAVGVGPDDMRLGIGDLISEIADDTPMVCANVTVAGFPISDGHKIIEVNGFKIGVTSVLGEGMQKGIRNPELEFTKPAQGIKEAHQKFTAAGCNLMVLLCHASTEETQALATSSKEARDFNVVITAGGADEPALQPERIPDTNSYLIQTGKKGMYVGAFGIFRNNRKQPWRYERIPLDARFEDSPEMLSSLKSYQQQLEVIYRQSGWEGLGLRPVKHPAGATFVGSAACQDCHEDEFEVWEQSPHHKATHSIAEPTQRSDIHRHFDPECLSCHVTGWDPQNYFPYASGYIDLERTPLLHGNGCENCHGPGSAHVAAENGDVDVSDEQIEKLRRAMRLELSKAEDTCLKCHDLDNDPHFQEDGAFEKYWKQIEH